MGEIREEEMNCLPDCQPAWIARNLRIRYGLNAGELSRKSSVIEWHLIHAIWRGAQVARLQTNGPMGAMDLDLGLETKYENNDKRTQESHYCTSINVKEFPAHKCFL